LRSLAVSQTATPAAMKRPMAVTPAASRKSSQSEFTLTLSPEAFRLAGGERSEQLTSSLRGRNQTKVLLTFRAR